MKVKSLIVLIGFIAPLMMLGLVSCGGGNDVASSGATAVSAAAPVTSTVSAPSTAATEAKVNGQVDERTGVAPVVAQLSLSKTARCLASRTYGGAYASLIDTPSCADGGTSCIYLGTAVPTLAECAALLPGIATGNPWTIFSNGGCLQSNTIALEGGTARLSDPQKAACLKEANRLNAIFHGTESDADINECKAMGGRTTLLCTCLYQGDASLDYCDEL